MKLQQQVTALVPADQTVLTDGTEVTPTAPDQTSVTVEGGTWTFAGWNLESPTIDGADVNFVGTWTFRENDTPLPNKYKAIHRFISGTLDKNLPSDVMNLLPRDIPNLENVTIVSPIMPTKLSVPVNDGTWRFVRYIKDEVVINNSDVIFTGTWVFTEKPIIIEDPIITPGLINIILTDYGHGCGTLELNKEDHYAYMYGYPDLSFRPDGNMTRAEAKLMFARLLIKTPQYGRIYNINFSDVKTNDWFYAAVGHLSEHNIVTGYPDGSFKPNNPITRAEFATMASKFDKLVAIEETRFVDVPMEHWALKFINSAAAKGWVN